MCMAVAPGPRFNRSELRRDRRQHQVDQARPSGVWAVGVFRVRTHMTRCERERSTLYLVAAYSHQTVAWSPSSPASATKGFRIARSRIKWSLPRGVSNQ